MRCDGPKNDHKVRHTSFKKKFCLGRFVFSVSPRETWMLFPLHLNLAEDPLNGKKKYTNIDKIYLRKSFHEMRNPYRKYKLSRYPEWHVRSAFSFNSLRILPPRLSFMFRYYLCSGNHRNWSVNCRFKSGSNLYRSETNHHPSGSGQHPYRKPSPSKRD